MQLDYDAALVPMRRVCDATEVKNGVHRSTTRAELAPSVTLKVCARQPRRTWATRVSSLVSGQVR